MDVESEQRPATLAAIFGLGNKRSRPSIPTPNRISCVVCAFNEASRIRHILDAVRGHPALIEVIVVNDGSTDGTEQVLRAYPDIRLISYLPNKGKTYALSRGIEAAKGDYLMLLDAALAAKSRGHDGRRVMVAVSGEVLDLDSRIGKRSLDQAFDFRRFHRHRSGPQMLANASAGPPAI